MRGHLKQMALRGFTSSVEEKPPATFAVYVSHTPWVKERAESMSRLMAQLQVGAPGVIRVWDEKAPNPVWSLHMWEDALKSSASHFVFLQDDIKVCPQFWAAVTALVEAHPTQAICLESVHHVIPLLAETGAVGITSPDGMIGPGYILPREWLEDALRWREASFNLKKYLEPEKPPFGEDTLLGFYSAATGKQILQTIPALIDHDVSIASTYGNETHGRRRPLVRWDNLELPTGASLVDSAYWKGQVVAAGLFYKSTPGVLREWVPSISNEHLTKLRGDNGYQLIRRISAHRRASFKGPATKIFIATPVRGNDISVAHAAALGGLLRDEQIECETSWEIIDAQLQNYDLVRVRSRLVKHFLSETDATHLLFLDGDVSISPTALHGMIRANKDFVAAPYPQREGIDFQKALLHMQHGNPAEAAYGYKVFFPEGKDFDIDADGCAEITRVGLGCCLLSRGMLESMTESYTPSLVFDDEATGLETVALFNLMFYLRRDGRRALLSEDMSFCERVRDCGYKIHVYLGNGSPVDHTGTFVYRGALEAFGCKRV